MPDRIRFHLDEHVDPAIATALRRAGIDVTTTIEAGLRTKSDEAQLQFARAGTTRYTHSRSRLPSPTASRQRSL
jgi:uncharacterized protein DUF5615